MALVVDDREPEAALFGAAGAAERLAPGAVIIASATMPPASARRLAAKAERRGFLCFDAPVLGGVRAAEEEAMVVMASRPDAAFATAEPVFVAIARKVWRVGSEGESVRCGEDRHSASRGGAPRRCRRNSRAWHSGWGGAGAAVRGDRLGGQLVLDLQRLRAAHPCWQQHGTIRHGHLRQGPRHCARYGLGVDAADRGCGASVLFRRFRRWLRRARPRLHHPLLARPGRDRAAGADRGRINRLG